MGDRMRRARRFFVCHARAVSLMKIFTAQFSYFVRSRRGRRNIRLLLRMLATLAVIVTIYSVLFHYIMAWEYRHHEQRVQYSWITGVYWTLTVMSTLGFGDITFQTDLGRVFSIIVLVSGTMFMLILLPFTFIQFFYAPWVEAQAASRAPRVLPEETTGHVLLTNYDPVTMTLIGKLDQFGYPYALLVQELDEALHLHDLGMNVVLGDLDDPDTYSRVRADRAALVATTASDTINTNVAATVRGVAPNVPIIATAKDPASVDILELAGTSHVLQLDVMMGRSLARRAIGGDAMTHVIGRVEQLLIAEANAARTPLVGKTLRENRLNELGVTVAGVWDRGQFLPAGPETMITEHTVLVLAGSKEQLLNYDEHFAIYNVSGAPVLVIGGSRVGQATSRELSNRGMDFCIVDREPLTVSNSDPVVVGSAAELEVLEKAGIQKTPTVIITPRDDNTNIYLTIYCRRLRPDVQIVSRATQERNVATLHRAGADSVMSYASMGANAAFNLLERSDILMVAEGLDILKLRVPADLEGKSLAESSIRGKTGCNVIAVSKDGSMDINPNPHAPLPADAELVLIGTVDAERRFLEVYRDTLRD
ncbi:MAG: NAD-binding protein [Phycisphaerales bacterium]|nr:NAD-binding protein [Phycisphaerales bacterium]